MTRLIQALAVSTLLLLCECAAFSQGQVAPQRPEKRIVTRTRLVAIFSDMENQLFEALMNRQHQALDPLLSDDFQLWSPSPPGDPVPRDDWKNQSMAENLKEFHIRQMAARAIDDNAVIVSFVLSKELGSSSHARAYDYFVVDLWRKADDKWKLSDRYAAPLTAGSRPARVRPSGKN